MSASKTHHYIPQWQLKFWSDKNDRVNVVNRRNKNEIKSYVSHVRNVFSKNYLYSIRDGSGGNNDALEKEIYGPLDYKAEKLTKEIISILDRNAIPDMNEGAKSQFWQFYFYNAHKRHPDSIKPYIEKLDFEKLHQESIQNAIDAGENEEHIRREMEDYDLKGFMEQEGIQYARAEQNSKVLLELGKMGIIFAIAPDDTAFILPDRSFEIGNAQQQDKELWIPIHPKFAVRFYLFDRKCSKRHLTKTDVRKMNEHWYGLANTVVSTSKKQLQSLVRNHDRKKITF